MSIHAPLIPLRSTFVALAAASTLGAGCMDMEKDNFEPGAGYPACTDASCPSDSKSGTTDGETDPAGAQLDPDPLYVMRAAQGLAAWQLGLGQNLAGLRTLGDRSAAHNPPNWITTAEDDCQAEGVSNTLRDQCPIGGDIIGVCETRYYPSTGEIVDSTLVVLTAYQESDASEDNKRAVFIHELGHCLGLRHSESEDDIMYATIKGADLPSNGEIDAMAAAYLPAPQLPATHVVDEFFNQTDTGAAVRQFAGPTFTISGSIGTQSARSWNPPPPGAALRGEVAVDRHLFHADGSCDDPSHARTR